MLIIPTPATVAMSKPAGWRISDRNACLAGSWNCLLTTPDCGFQVGYPLIALLLWLSQESTASTPWQAFHKAAISITEAKYTFIVLTLKKKSGKSNNIHLLYYVSKLLEQCSVNQICWFECMCLNSSCNHIQCHLLKPQSFLFLKCLQQRNFCNNLGTHLKLSMPVIFTCITSGGLAIQVLAVGAYF